jgi:hypothetical protein
MMGLPDARRALPHGTQPRACIPEINRPITYQSAMRPGFPAAVLDYFGIKSAIRAGFNRVHGRGPGGSSTCADACRGGAGTLGRERANTTNFRIALRTVSMFRAYLRTIEAPLPISLVSLPSEVQIAGDSMPTTSVKEIEKTPPCLPDNQAMTSLHNPAFADQSARWGVRT